MVPHLSAHIRQNPVFIEHKHLHEMEALIFHDTWCWIGCSQLFFVVAIWKWFLATAFSVFTCFTCLSLDVLMSFFYLSFPLFFKLLFSSFCSVFRPTALSCFDFQGIPGEPGKRGKMGRPVKFCLNILYSQSCDELCSSLVCALFGFVKL